MRVDRGRGGTTTVPATAAARALEDPALRERYRRAYRGDGDPIDALRWLDHPEDPSPTGLPSPWAALRVQRRRLYAADAGDEELQAVLALEQRATAMRDAAAEALRAVTAEAPRTATAPPPGSPDRRDPLPSGPLLALLCAAVMAAVLAVAVLSLPKPHVDRPELARSLQTVFPGAIPRPHDLRLALSGRGSETVSRTVTGSAPMRITTILCRGAGSIRVRLSDRADDGVTMPCVDGAARLTRLLDEMPRAPFLVTVAVSGPVAWSVTVTDEDVGMDERTYPRCIGASC